MSPQTTAANGPSPAAAGNRDHVPLRRIVPWAGGGVSAAANFLVMGYVALYSTDTLGLHPAVVGVMLLVGNVCSGLGALVAAWVVERSPETRFGKARPYEFAVVLTWFATWLMFSTPTALGPTGRTVWVFVTFVGVMAVFDNLLRANDLLYMARAFVTRQSVAEVATRAGVLTSVASIVVSVTLPMALAAAGRSPAGWSQAVLVFALVFGAIGVLRFFFVEEVRRTDAGAPPPSVRDLLVVVRSTHWIWLLAAVQLLASAVVGSSINAYYFRYVYGDLGAQGLVAGAGVVVLPLILLFPRIMRRVEVSRIVGLGALCGVLGSLVYAVAGASLPLLVLGSALSGVGLLPVSYLINIMALDLATYNEARGLRRMESTIGAIVGVAQKLGTGLAGILVGQVLALTGYDGALDRQSPGTETAIVALFAWYPAASFVLIAVLMAGYHRFERADLRPARQRLAAAGAADTGGIDGAGGAAEKAGAPPARGPVQAPAADAGTADPGRSAAPDHG